MTKRSGGVDVESQIRMIRGVKVILDMDLAAIYGVETKILNKAVSRNRKRFPPDFAFRLTAQEFTDLKFQNGTSNEGRGGRRYPRKQIGFGVRERRAKYRTKRKKI